MALGHVRLVLIADMSAIQKKQPRWSEVQAWLLVQQARSIPEISSLILFMAECVTLTSSADDLLRQIDWARCAIG